MVPREIVSNRSYFLSKMGLAWKFSTFTPVQVALDLNTKDERLTLLQNLHDSYVCAESIKRGWACKQR